MCERAEKERTRERDREKDGGSLSKNVCTRARLIMYDIKKNEKKNIARANKKRITIYIQI